MEKIKKMSKLCKQCCKYKMPKDSIYNKEKKGYNYVKVIVTFIFLCIVAWFIPDLNPQVYKYKEMHENDLYIGSSIKISSIEYLSESVKEKNLDLAEMMKKRCKDDVLFAFQFLHIETNRSIEDHIFMLCSERKVFANAEVVKSSDKFIMCNEQYAEVTKKIKRPSSVRIKAIDVDLWDMVEYESKNKKEACVIQHAIDILNSKWV